VWPCAVHHVRPELSLDEARQLLTLECARLVIGLIGIKNETATQEGRDRFAEAGRLVASEEDKWEFTFRVMAKRGCLARHKLEFLKGWNLGQVTIDAEARARGDLFGTKQRSSIESWLSC